MPLHRRAVIAMYALMLAVPVTAAAQSRAGLRVGLADPAPRLVTESSHTNPVQGMVVGAAVGAVVGFILLIRGIHANGGRSADFTIPLLAGALVGLMVSS